MARLWIRVGEPSHVQGRRKRVQAIGRTGSCNVAALHVVPPSVETSTRVIVPRPDQASPVISTTPGPGNVWPPEGEVMTDLASMTKVNSRAVPSGMRSL